MAQKVPEPIVMDAIIDLVLMCIKRVLDALEELCINFWNEKLQQLFNILQCLHKRIIRMCFLEIIEKKRKAILPMLDEGITQILKQAQVRWFKQATWYIKGFMNENKVVLINESHMTYDPFD
eukprot:207435_1